MHEMYISAVGFSGHSSQQQDHSALQAKNLSSQEVPIAQASKLGLHSVSKSSCGTSVLN